MLAIGADTNLTPLYSGKRRLNGKESAKLQDEQKKRLYIEECERRFDAEVDRAIR